MTNAAAAVPRQAEPPRVYSYTRYSTPQQQQGDSLRRQTAAAEMWARANGYELDGSLNLRDLGVSAYRGANVGEGSALGQFLEAVREGAVPKGSILFMESLDRLSRMPTRKARDLFESIIDAGVGIFADGTLFTLENYDLTKMIVALVVASRAAEESATKGRRIRAAWESKRTKARARESTVFAGRHPAWLKRQGDSFTPIPKRVEIVKLIYLAAKRGIGIESICVFLNGNKEPTFGPSPLWGRTSVDRLLRNPAVIGTLQPHEIVHSDGKKSRKPLGEPIANFYPAIIPVKLFTAVQALRGERSTVAPERAIQNLFGGLLKCATCGGGITRASKGANGGRAKLICITAHRGGGCSNVSRLPYDDFERAALEALPRLLAEAPLTATGEIEEQIEKLTAQIEGAGDVMDKLLAALERGGTSPAITRRLSEYQTERDRLEVERRKLSAEAVRLGSPLVVRQLRRLRTGSPLSHPVPPSRRAEAAQRLRSVIQSVSLDVSTGWAVVGWRAGGGSESAFHFAFPPQ
jgi:DNA invertase Pin-like site-specific DNA recombinase